MKRERDFYEMPDGLIVPGAKVRYFHELRHIRAIVDDDQVVYRVWRSGRWRYHIEWMYGFYLAWKDGMLKRV